MIEGMRRVMLSISAAVILTSWVMVGWAQAQVRPAEGQSAAQQVLRFEVTIGKSQVVDLKEAFTRVSVTNPAIADIFVVTPNQILINGKAAGVTSLVVFYPNKTLYFDLVVQTDIALLKERIKTIAPRDEIEVRAAKDTIILNGSVGSEELVGQVEKVAEIFAPKKVVNLLKVADVRNPAGPPSGACGGGKSQGPERAWVFDGCAIGNSFHRRRLPGGSAFAAGYLPLWRHYVQWVGGRISDSANWQRSSLAAGTRNFAGIVRALAEKDLLRTLAKPNLDHPERQGSEIPLGRRIPLSRSNFLRRRWDYGHDRVQAFRSTVGVHSGGSRRPDNHAEGGPRSEQPRFLARPSGSGLQHPDHPVEPGRCHAGVQGRRELRDGRPDQHDRSPAGRKDPVPGRHSDSRRVVPEHAISRMTRRNSLFLVTPRIVKPFAPGDGPDPTKLLDLRESERDPNTGINTLRSRNSRMSGASSRSRSARVAFRAAGDELWMVHSHRISLEE